MNWRFPATARSHGQVGFYVLVFKRSGRTDRAFQANAWLFFKSDSLMIFEFTKELPLWQLQKNMSNTWIL